MSIVLDIDRVRDAMLSTLVKMTPQNLAVGPHGDLDVAIVRTERGVRSHIIGLTQRGQAWIEGDDAAG